MQNPPPILISRSIQRLRIAYRGFEICRARSFVLINSGRSGPHEGSRFSRVDWQYVSCYVPRVVFADQKQTRSGNGCDWNRLLQCYRCLSLAPQKTRGFFTLFCKLLCLDWTRCDGVASPYQRQCLLPDSYSQIVLTYDILDGCSQSRGPNS